MPEPRHDVLSDEEIDHIDNGASFFGIDRDFAYQLYMEGRLEDYGFELAEENHKKKLGIFFDDGIDDDDPTE